VTCVVAVGANLWLIPHAGITGAAIGILIPYLIQGILRHAELRYVFGWPSRWRELMRPIAAAALAAVPALGCRLIMPGIPGQIAAVAVFLGLYVGAWWLMGLEPADRAVVEAMTRADTAAQVE